MDTSGAVAGIVDQCRMGHGRKFELGLHHGLILSLLGRRAGAVAVLQPERAEADRRIRFPGHALLFQGRLFFRCHAPDFGPQCPDFCGLSGPGPGGLRRVPGEHRFPGG